MKEYDVVKVIKDRKSYIDEGVRAGDIGIIMGENRNGYVLVVFPGEVVPDENGVYYDTGTDIAATEEDLEIVEGLDFPPIWHRHNEGT